MNLQKRIYLISHPYQLYFTFPPAPISSNSPWLLLWRSKGAFPWNRPKFLLELGLVIQQDPSVAGASRTRPEIHHFYQEFSSLLVPFPSQHFLEESQVGNFIPVPFLTDFFIPTKWQEGAASFPKDSHAGRAGISGVFLKYLGVCKLEQIIPAGGKGFIAGIFLIPTPCWSLLSPEPGESWSRSFGINHFLEEWAEFLPLFPGFTPSQS